MPYDLEQIERFCLNEGLSYELISPEEIHVCICQDIDLCFVNIDQGSDTFLGFRGSPWHTHGDLILMTGDDTFVELDPISVLTGLRCGEIAVCSSYSRGELTDRWMFHRKEKQDFQYLEAGESINIQTAERADSPNSHAFGTFVTDPAVAGSAPKASGSR